MKQKIIKILEDHTYHVDDYKYHKNLYAIDKIEFEQIAEEIIKLFNPVTEDLYDRIKDL